MVNFSILDSELDGWATQVGLEWARNYRDEEVRSIDIDIGYPHKAQIWIEPSPDGANVDVKAWDRKRRTFSETTRTLGKMKDDCPGELEPERFVSQSWKGRNNLKRRNKRR